LLCAQCLITNTYLIVKYFKSCHSWCLVCTCTLVMLSDNKLLNERE
jgi:hypothetical protein